MRYEKDGMSGNWLFTSRCVEEVIERVFVYEF